MGACREGFNLANKFGRRTFFRNLRRGRFERLMWRDTFGPLLCWLSGEHIAIRQNFYGDNGEVETSCSCCCRWLKQDGHKWIVS